MPDGIPQATWQEAQPGWSVPVSAPAQATQTGPDIGQLIQNIAQPVNPQLIQAATTPITGSHAAMVPSSLTTPVAPHQNMPFDTRRVVGRGNARRQGIGNAFTGAINALGQIVSKEAQLKQNGIRDAAQKVIISQQAIDEAQQQLDMATANGDTATALKMKDIIAQNTHARDAIFADPKMRKALVKGFDISYTDPGSNKTEEHAAVQEALKNAKTWQEKREIMRAQQQKQQEAAGAQAGAAYAKSQPQGLAPNTSAIQQLQIAQANQKVQQAALKDYLTFTASIRRADATVDAARVREMGSSMLQAQRLGFQQDMQQQRFAQAEKLLGERFDNQVKLLGMRMANARQLAKDIWQDKEADPLTMYTKTRKASEEYQKSMQSAIKDYQALQGQRETLYANAKTAGVKPGTKEYADFENQVKALDYQIGLVHDAIQNSKANSDSFAQQANQIQSIFGLDKGASSNAGDTGSSSSGQSDSTGGSTDFADPLTYLNSSDGEDSDQ